MEGCGCAQCQNIIARIQLQCNGHGKTADPSAVSNRIDILQFDLPQLFKAGVGRIHLLIGAARTEQHQTAGCFGNSVNSSCFIAKQCAVILF